MSKMEIMVFTMVMGFVLYGGLELMRLVSEFTK